MIKDVTEKLKELTFYSITENDLERKNCVYARKLLKIKVVNDDGRDVDYKVLFFREAICRILLRSLSFGLSDVLSLIIMIVRDDNKNLQDVFAKTKVIDLKEED